MTVVSPATDPNSTTVQVWVQADNPGEQLKPGASVHVAITVATIKAATVVPAAAILPGEEGGTAVLTVVRIEHRAPKQVEVGVREGDKVQILSGVSARRRSGGRGRHGRGRQGQGAKSSTPRRRKPTRTSPPTKRGKDEKKDEAKPKEQMSDLVTPPPQSPEARSAALDGAATASRSSSSS